MPMLKITQTRSPIGLEKSQGATVRGLGLHRIRHSVMQPDNPAIRGMIFKVKHLVMFEVVADATPGTTNTTEVK